MFHGHSHRSIAFLLIAFILVSANRHAVQAQEGWLPFQNYDDPKEAAPGARLKLAQKGAKEIVPPAKARLVSIETLNLQVRQLYKEGKYEEATSLASQALTSAERLNLGSSFIADALDNLALIHKARGRFREAEPLYARALAIREKTLDPNHPDVGNSLINLAGLYYAQARHSEAELLLKRSLVIAEMLGPGHPLLGTSLLDLAGLYWAQARYAEAEPLFDRALAIRKKALGAEHPDVRTALINLAGLYWAQARYAEAEPLYKDALAIRREALGPEHAEVGTALNNLAGLYRTQARYLEAEPLYVSARAILEKALGPNHPDVGSSLNNLAALYFAQARYVEAEALFRRSLAIAEMLGPGHPAVGTSLLDLAGLYWAQGRYAKAEPLYSRALAIREKALGAEHPDVGTALINFAGLYWAQGRYAEAEPLFERARTIREKALGPNHPDVGTALINLAGLYWAQGRYAKAEPLNDRGLAIRKRSLGPDHPDVATLLNNLGELYRAQGRYAEAEPPLARARAIREKALGPDHPDVGTSLNNLGDLYRVLGRYAEAKPLYARARDIREKALGPDHPDVATSLNNLAGVLYLEDAYPEDANKSAEVERLYSRALSVAVEALGADHPTVALIRGNLGAFFKSEGRISEAEPLLTLALERAEKVLGPEHPQVVNAIMQLAELYGVQGRTKEANYLFGRAGAQKSVGLQAIPVFFATNRKRDPSKKGIAFGTERGQLAFGVAKVVVPLIASSRPARRMARPAPEITISDERRLAVEPVKLLDAQRLVRDSRRRLFEARGYLGQTLVFVHGFRMSFDNAVRRAGQLAHDLAFDGPIFVFSWPSRGSLSGYVDDRESAGVAGEALKEFLRLIVAETKASRIHLIAHSMGNVTVTAAFDKLGRDTAERLPFGEVIHAAPDVDIELFAQTFGDRDGQQAKGTKSTIYASSVDLAMIGSSALRNRSQLGYIPWGGPTLVLGVETIDITNVSFNLFGLNHGVYATSPSIVGDMRRLLKDGQRPPDKRTQEFEPVIAKQGKTYWRYRGPDIGLEQAAEVP